MNERIRELATQATTITYEEDGWRLYGTEVETFNKEKFAELIVRKCARVAIQQQTQNDIDGNVSKNPGKDFAYALIEHFGVEE